MTTNRLEKVTFIGADGESRLDARLDLPASPPRAFALFAHCFTCSKQILAATRIAEGLNRHGIAVLRFDFTGLGASEGEFANTTFASNVGDLIAAAAWLRGEGHPPALLFSGDRMLELATGGTVIGPLPEASFRHGYARMEPGDVLVLCTDGILERRNRAGDFFGQERLEAAVRPARGEQAAAILERVFESARAFGKARHWDDDATLVVLRRA